jgi:hypothetical protein
VGSGAHANLQSAFFGLFGRLRGFTGRRGLRAPWYGMELLLIRYEHILQLEALSPHHPDPFDRLLAAQSVVEKRAILPVTKSSRIILSS